METATGSIDLGEIKRCYVEGLKIRLVCPRCNSVLEHDFSEQYISYPNIGDADSAFFHCEKCAGFEGNEIADYILPIKIISAVMTIEFDPKKLKRD